MCAFHCKPCILSVNGSETIAIELYTLLWLFQCRTSTSTRQGGFMVCDLMSGASKGSNGSGSGTTSGHDLYKDSLRNFKFDFRN